MYALKEVPGAAEAEALRQRSAERDAVAAELGGDLQAAAERFSVAGRRADVRGARVGVLDGGHLVGKELLSQRPSAVVATRRCLGGLADQCLE
jgi:hypothetical protein